MPTDILIAFLLVADFHALQAEFMCSKSEVPLGEGYANVVLRFSFQVALRKLQ